MSEKYIKFAATSVILISTFLFSSCGNGVADAEAKRTADSTAIVQHITDSTRAVDSTKALEEKARLFNLKDSANTIAVMGIELTDSSCLDITKIIAIDTIQDPMIYSLYVLKAIECKNRIFNQQNPEAATVTVVHQENGRILFNTMRVNTAEKIADAAKKIITIGAFVKSNGDVPITTVATIAGNYSVGAYLKAAKVNNPLIILMPTVIPNVQMVKDALTLNPENIIKAFPLDPTEPLKIVANGAEFTFVGAKAAAKFAASTPGYAIDATGKVVKVIGKGAEGIGKGAKKAADIATAPLKKIGRKLGF